MSRANAALETMSLDKLIFDCVFRSVLGFVMGNLLIAPILIQWAQL